MLQKGRMREQGYLPPDEPRGIRGNPWHGGRAGSVFPLSSVEFSRANRPSQIPARVCPWVPMGEGDWAWMTGSIPWGSSLASLPPSPSVPGTPLVSVRAHGGLISARQSCLSACDQGDAAEWEVRIPTKTTVSPFCREAIQSEVSKSCRRLLNTVEELVTATASAVVLGCRDGARTNWRPGLVDASARRAGN